MINEILEEKSLKKMLRSIWLCNFWAAIHTIWFVTNWDNERSWWKAIRRHSRNHFLSLTNIFSSAGDMVFKRGIYLILFILSNKKVVTELYWEARYLRNRNVVLQKMLSCLEKGLSIFDGEIKKNSWEKIRQLDDYWF